MSSIAENPSTNLELSLARVGPDVVEQALLSRRFEQLATVAEIIGDFLAVTLAIYSAYAIYHSFRLGQDVVYPASQVVVVAAIFAALFVVMLERDGAYREGSGLLRVRETERALRVSVQTFLLALPMTILAAHLISRIVLCLAFFLVPLIVITEKEIFFIVVRGLHLRGFGVRRVLIYGAGFTGRRVFSALVRSPKLGLQPVALIDDNHARVGEGVYPFDYRRERSVPVVSGPPTPELMRTYGAEMLIIAIPTLDRAAFVSAAQTAAEANARLAFVPNQVVSSEADVDHADIDGLMLNTLGPATSKSLYELGKRVLDLAMALFLVAALAPLFLIIALAVRLDSEGPIIFRQVRVGRNGRLFSIYKFRSMRVEAPAYSLSPKESQDPRITILGRWLRKTSLDELPQLFNVLRGEMSLVGPRPEMPFIVERYGPRERRRLGVVPGITGLWQLSADRAYLIHENLQYDLYYIKNRNLFMDISILLHTVVFAMRGV